MMTKEEVGETKVLNSLRKSWRMALIAPKLVWMMGILWIYLLGRLLPLPFYSPRKERALFKEILPF
ncbi:hypothetical protein STRDD12_00545 [Streptococcus sp. DD12]|nr:hypothetical protein STRDD12_00545 [Streptococcus sp. DD12]